MPRIQFNCESSDKWYEETGEGTSTFDICNKCLQVDSKVLLIKLGGLYNGEPQPSDDEQLTHDDIGVNNPSLHEGEDVFCECCDSQLYINHNY
jgi:hypothetical protein